MSEVLAQGPYVAARVGFEPAIFQTQGTKPTTLLPCPIKANPASQCLTTVCLIVCQRHPATTHHVPST